MEEKKEVQEIQEEVVRISVRNLVEFILREGDLDNRQGGTADREAMLLGGRIHRKIQRQMGSGYHAEVPLQMVVPCEKLKIVVEGRADGIIEEKDRIAIDEIKGVLMDLEMVKEPKMVHLAQAKCYACIYAKKRNLDEIGVQMTYCQMETEEVKRFYQTYGCTELEKWFLNLVHQYEKWALFQIEWRKKRTVPDRMEEEAKRLHSPGGVSISLSGRAERSGGVSLPFHFEKEKALYPGADRSREDHCFCVSCGESCRGGTCQSDLLPDCKDNYKNSGGEGFSYLERARALLQGHHSDSEGKDLFL